MKILDLLDTVHSVWPLTSELNPTYGSQHDVWIWRFWSSWTPFTVSDLWRQSLISRSFSRQATSRFLYSVLKFSFSSPYRTGLAQADTTPVILDFFYWNTADRIEGVHWGGPRFFDVVLFSSYPLPPHCKEPLPKIGGKIFPEKELRGHSHNFHIHVSVSDLYIPTINLPILLQIKCGPILGIYKSLTDTWM